MKIAQDYLFKNSKRKHYFEGYYIKSSSVKNQTISVIMGICKNGKTDHSFVQIIENITNTSHYFSFPLEDFSFCNNPFHIKVGDTTLTKNYLSIALYKENFSLSGTVYFHHVTKLKTSLYSPTIMGPFSYLPFMQCKHAIYSMGHYLTGSLLFNNEKINLDNGTGYIEKDYGCSFPKKYLWMQALKTNKKKIDSSLFIAVASIPMLLFSFQGIICNLQIQGKEYRFATYYGVNCQIQKKTEKEKIKHLVTLTQGDTILELTLHEKKGLSLSSPKKGSMHNTVFEQLNTKLELTLQKNNKIIYQTTYDNCSYEWEYDQK